MPCTHDAGADQTCRQPALCRLLTQVNATLWAHATYLSNGAGGQPGVHAQTAPPWIRLNRSPRRLVRTRSQVPKRLLRSGPRGPLFAPLAPRHRRTPEGPQSTCRNRHPRPHLQWQALREIPKTVLHKRHSAALCATSTRLLRDILRPDPRQAYPLLSSWPTSSSVTTTGHRPRGNNPSKPGRLLPVTASWFTLSANPAPNRRLVTTRRDHSNQNRPRPTRTTPDTTSKPVHPSNREPVFAA